MSGVNWIPGWALGGSDRDDRFRVVSGGRVSSAGLRNWYSDEEIGEAQALLAGQAAAALAGHEALWAWDLGNENSNCVIPPTRASAGRWLERIVAAIRAADETALVTVGLHMEDLEEDRKLGPSEASGACESALDARLPDLRQVVGRSHRRAPAGLPRPHHKLAGEGP